MKLLLSTGFTNNKSSKIKFFANNVTINLFFTYIIRNQIKKVFNNKQRYNYEQR